jgi:hypothetical protein
MPVIRLIRTFLLLGLLAAAATPVAAAEVNPRNCLNKTEQRVALLTHKAVPLVQAMKSVRQRVKRAELVRARLCRGGSGLVYSLTLLGRSGKVIRATVDAANGELLSAR